MDCFTASLFLILTLTEAKIYLIETGEHENIQSLEKPKTSTPLKSLRFHDYMDKTRQKEGANKHFKCGVVNSNGKTHYEESEDALNEIENGMISPPIGPPPCKTDPSECEYVSSKYPWMTALYLVDGNGNLSFHCGASLISKKVKLVT